MPPDVIQYPPSKADEHLFSRIPVMMKESHSIQVLIDIADEVRPALVDFLLGLSPTGVVEGTDWGEESQPVTVYFAPDEAATALESVRIYLASLANLWGDGVVRELSVSEIGNGWRTEYRHYFAAKKVTDRLVVAPPWEHYEPEGDEIVIEIVPGRAFGTGTHETTILCLRAMEGLFRKGNVESLLDVGGGSGILAIAGALLGAKRVTAVESDPEAVQAAQENLVANRVSDRVRVVHAAFPDGIAPGETFNIVIANLTGTDIRTHAGKLTGAAADGGFLIVSGFLVEEADSITKALSSKGKGRVEHLAMGEWGAAVFDVGRGRQGRQPIERWNEKTGVWSDRGRI
jgi:ribosomal protein L11 methyltransferase